MISVLPLFNASVLLLHVSLLQCFIVFLCNSYSEQAWLKHEVETLSRKIKLLEKEMQFQQQELKLHILKQKNNLEIWEKNLEIELWQKIKEVEIMQQELLAEHEVSKQEKQAELSVRKMELSNDYLKDCLKQVPRKTATDKGIIFSRIEVREDLINPLCKDVFNIYNKLMLDGKDNKDSIK